LQDVAKKCLKTSFAVAAVYACKSKSQPPFVTYQCVVIVSVLALLMKATKILAVFSVDKAQGHNPKEPGKQSPDVAVRSLVAISLLWNDRPER
jgi:hypothetical protein